jgi:3-oxoacyl-[acyl-carrier-protein] synthase II
MSNPVITAWSAVSAYGIGRTAFADGVRTGRAADGTAGEVPDTVAHLVPGFTPAAALGKKGTRSMDRVTGLAVAVVGDLLGGKQEHGEDIGLVLGTTTGSAQSIMDFTRDSLTGDKPYFVDPARFPNTVMNCAAGQCAIWYGLRGPNATVAGGRTSVLYALTYARRLLDAGRAGTVLCGAAEEYSPARAWLEWHSGGRAALGEGSVMLQLSPAGDGLAEVLSVQTGVGSQEALAACVQRALDAAGIAAEEISAVAGDPEPVSKWMTGLQIGLDPLIGDASAAAAAFQLVAALTLGEPGSVVLVTSVDRSGAVGCALLRLSASAPR